MMPNKAPGIQQVVASALAELVVRHCRNHNPPSDALLLVSDLPLPTLRHTEEEILQRGDPHDFLFEDGTVAVSGVSVEDKDGSIVQILPYCIDEESANQTRSQGWAGKLRDSFPHLSPQPDSLCVRWLIILGKPTALDLDTFVTTTRRSRFTETGQSGDRRSLLHALSERKPELKEYLSAVTEVYVESGKRLQDDRVFHLLVDFYEETSDFESLCRNLPCLGFLPDRYDDAISTARFEKRIRENLKLAEELAQALESSEDLDSWFDDRFAPKDARKLKQSIWGLMRPDLEELLAHWPEGLTYSGLIGGEHPGSDAGSSERPSVPPKPSLKEIITQIEIRDEAGSVPNSLIPESLYVLHPGRLHLAIDLERPLEGEEEIRVFVNEKRLMRLSNKGVECIEASVDLRDVENGELSWLQIGAYPTPRAWNSKPRDSRDFHFYSVPEDQGWLPYEGGLSLSQGRFVAESTVDVLLEPLDDWDGEVNLSLLAMSRRRRWTLYDDVKLDRRNKAFARSIEELRREAQKTANEPVDIDSVMVRLSDKDGSAQFTVYFGESEEFSTQSTVTSVPHAILLWMVGEQYDELQNAHADFEFVYRYQREDRLEFKIGPSPEAAPEEATSHRCQMHVPWLLRALEDVFLSDPDSPLPIVVTSVDEETKEFTHRSVTSDDQPDWEFQFAGDWEAYAGFVDRRTKLFDSLSQELEELSIDTLAGLSLLGFSELIEDYADAYHRLIDDIVERYEAQNRGNPIPGYNSLLFVDAVYVPSRAGSEAPYSMLLVSPTHPLRLLFLLELERKVMEWQKTIRDDEAAFTLFSTDFQQISGENLPLFLCGIGAAEDQVFVSGPPPSFHWGMLVPFADRLQDKFLTDSILGQTAQRCLFPDHVDAPDSSLAGAIKSRINAFLEAHPFLGLREATVHINFFNPGTAEKILTAIEEVVSSRGDESPSFSIRLIDLKDHGEPEIPGPTTGIALDRLFARVDTITEQQRLTRDCLTYSVAALSQDRLSSGRFPEENYAHLHFVADLFNSALSLSKWDRFPPSVFEGGLISEFDLEFAMADRQFYGGLWFPARPSSGESDSPLIGLSRSLAEIIAAQIRPPYGRGVALYSTLSLGQASKELILPLHLHGIWVCFLDRDVGIEGFDFPQVSEEPNDRDIFLLDYTRKFEQELGGYDMITTTQKIDSVRSIIKNHLSQNKYGLSTQGEQTGAQKILSRVNALSGRWGMSLVNLLPNEIGGICGNAIVLLYLESEDQRFVLDGEKNNRSLSVVLPTDAYLRVSGKDGRPLQDGWKWQSPYREGSCSDDLLELRLEERENGHFSIVGTLIEVKHGIAARQRVDEGKEQIINAHRILHHRFVEHQGNRIDAGFRQAELSRLIAFHGAKLARHGLYGIGKEERRAIRFIRDAASAVQAGAYSITFTSSFGTDRAKDIDVNGLVALVDLDSEAKQISRSTRASSLSEVVGVLRLPSGFIQKLLE